MKCLDAFYQIFQDYCEAGSHEGGISKTFSFLHEGPNYATCTRCKAHQTEQLFIIELFY